MERMPFRRESDVPRRFLALTPLDWNAVFILRLLVHLLCIPRQTLLETVSKTTTDKKAHTFRVTVFPLLTIFKVAPENSASIPSSWTLRITTQSVLFLLVNCCNLRRLYSFYPCPS